MISSFSNLYHFFFSFSFPKQKTILFNTIRSTMDFLKCIHFKPKSSTFSPLFISRSVSFAHELFTAFRVKLILIIHWHGFGLKRNGIFTIIIPRFEIDKQKKLSQAQEEKKTAHTLTLARERPYLLI